MQGRDNISEVISYFYLNLYTEDFPGRPQLEMLNVRCISQDQRNEFEWLISVEDVRGALDYL